MNQTPSPESLLRPSEDLTGYSRVVEGLLAEYGLKELPSAFQCKFDGSVHKRGVWHEGDTPLVPAARRRRSSSADKSALSLLLRRSARIHLGLKDGEYWPSDVADAQAAAVIAAGWTRLTPPAEKGQADA